LIGAGGLLLLAVRGDGGVCGLLCGGEGQSVLLPAGVSSSWCDTGKDSLSKAFDGFMSLARYFLLVSVVSNSKITASTTTMPKL
jgi:hypothetical protein